MLVKDSLLAWLSSYAKKIPGYELLTVILEKDPFTGDAVPRTAENLIKGFILLLPGGDEMYAKLAESGVIANAAGRITSAMTELNISWELITDTFLGVWNLVTLESLLSPIETFNKILDQFGEPARADHPVRGRRDPGRRRADPAADELPARDLRAHPRARRRRRSTTSSGIRSSSCSTSSRR